MHRVPAKPPRRGAVRGVTRSAARAARAVLRGVALRAVLHAARAAPPKTTPATPKTITPTTPTTNNKRRPNPQVDAKKAAGPTWETVRYMVSQIQYGGRITDDLDKLLMDTYAERYFTPAAVQVGRGVRVWGVRGRVMGLGGRGVARAQQQLSGFFFHCLVATRPAHKSHHPNTTAPCTTTTPTATPHTHTQSPAPSCTATSARRFRTACPTAPTSTPSGVCVAAACAVLCVLLRAAACCVLRAACCVLQRTAPRGATTMHTTTNPGRHPCPHTHTPKKHHSAYIETLPGQESPALFGLHANADLTFRSLQVRAVVGDAWWCVGGGADYRGTASRRPRRRAAAAARLLLLCARRAAAVV